MRKKLSIIVILIILSMIILIGCLKKEKDFDATGYVKSSLDAIYHQEYKEYAKFLDISEKEAKANLEEDFEESINQEFDNFEGICIQI